MEYPHPSGLDGVTLHQDWMGHPNQDWMGVPPISTKWGYPHPNRETATEQHSEYLLRSGQCASCVHAGRLSCLVLILTHHFLVYIKLITRLMNIFPPNSSSDIVGRNVSFVLQVNSEIIEHESTRRRHVITSWFKSHSNLLIPNSEFLLIAHCISFFVASTNWQKHQISARGKVDLDLQ